MVQILIEDGANINATNNDGNTAIFFAVNGTESMMNLLIENGADVNAVNKKATTPLIECCKLGYDKNTIACKWGRKPKCFRF